MYRTLLDPKRLSVDPPLARRDGAAPRQGRRGGRLLDGGGRAATRTGREGVASAALPNFDLYVVTIDDFDELYISTIGEGWVHFN